MNYTEKYHLPQWKKEDRIMMEDFNQMCQDIESGLAEHAAEGLALAERIALVEREARELAEAGGSSAKEALLRGLLRAAYNHIETVAAAGVPTARSATFYQTLGSDSTVTGSNILRMSDCCWAGQAAAAFTAEELRSQITVVSTMKIVKDKPSECVPLVLEFTPTGAGCIRQMILTGEYNNAGGLECRCKVEVQNLTEKTTVLTNESMLIRSGAASGSIGVLVNNLTFHGGCRYQLTATPLTTTADAVLKFESSRDFQASCYNTAMPAVLSYTFRETEGSTGGLAVLRYDTYGTDGTLTAVWDGETLTPAAIRTVVDSEGRTLKEAEFRRTSAVSANSTLQVRAECEANGELYLYNWGGVLI